MGEMTISRVRGLQIVNGAQTTASIIAPRKLTRSTSAAWRSP